MTYKNKLLRVTLYCYMLIVVVFAFIRMLSAFGYLNFLNNAVGEMVLNLIVQVGLLFVVSTFGFAKLMKTKSKNVFNFYGFKKTTFRVVIFAILIGFIVYFLNIFISYFFNIFLSLLGYNFSSGSVMTSYPFWLLLLNLLFTAVLPGICEETAHRGMLLNGMAPLGAKKALLFSSLLFGLLHLNIEQVFYATLIGLLIGYISLRCCNIIPAMIIHFTNNAMSVFMSYSSFHGLGFEWGINLVNSWLTSNPLLGILFVIILIAFLFILLKILLKQLFKFSHFERMNKIQWAMIQQYERERYLKEVENISNGNFEPINHQDIFFENFDQKYSETAASIGLKSEMDFELENDTEPFKLDSITRVMLITTFVIVSAITLFTFIWGVL